MTIFVTYHMGQKSSAGTLNSTPQNLQQILPRLLRALWMLAHGGLHILGLAADANGNGGPRQPGQSLDGSAQSSGLDWDLGVSTRLEDASAEVRSSLGIKMIVMRLPAWPCRGVAH